MKTHKNNGSDYRRQGGCNLCGECCRYLGLDIEIPIEPNGKSKAKVARTEKQKEINRYLKKGYKDVEVGRATWLKKDILKFTLSLTCPHLRSNKCVIHSRKGYNKKPDFCQRFPEPKVPRPTGCGYRFRKL